MEIDGQAIPRQNGEANSRLINIRLKDKLYREELHYAVFAIAIEC